MVRPGGRSELRHSRSWGVPPPPGGSQRGLTLGVGLETEEEKQSK